MNDKEFHDRLHLAVTQKPDGFQQAMRVVRDGISRNAFDINGLTYDFCPDTECVTVMCRGAIVGVMTQSFFECLAKYRG